MVEHECLISKLGRKVNTKILAVALRCGFADLPHMPLADVHPIPIADATTTQRILGEKSIGCVLDATVGKEGELQCPAGANGTSFCAVDCRC